MHFMALAAYTTHNTRQQTPKNHWGIQEASSSHKLVRLSTLELVEGLLGQFWNVDWCPVL